MRVDLIEESNEGLCEVTWVFRLSDSGILKLKTYIRMERPSKRHKFRFSHIVAPAIPERVRAAILEKARAMVRFEGE